MGIDTTEFVYPERISNQLFCPICTLILETPVMTEYEHLYCENCLLEWLLVKETCPLTQDPIHIDRVKPAGRIIQNMLLELIRYCCYRDEGCLWTGEQNNYHSHIRNCNCRPKNIMLEEIEKYKNDVDDYKLQIDAYRDEVLQYKNEVKYKETEIDQYKSKIKDLEQILLVLNSKIKMYDKLHTVESRQSSRVEEIVKEQSEFVNKVPTKLSSFSSHDSSQLK